ncbi:MAG: YbaB/EbfC family nucleoid-associated protein, partial [Ignavibacteriaceae bacterium]
NFHKELKENLKEFEKNSKGFRFNIMIDSNLAKLKHDTSFNKNFKIFVDSNVCRVELGNIHIPHIELPDFDSIAAQIDKATSNIRNFAFSIPQFDGKNHFRFKFREGDSTHSFNFKIPNIDSLIGLHRNFFYSPGDSTAAFRFFRNDSLINQKEFHKQMQKLQKEIEKMREEMKNLKNDLKKETKKSKSVEI